MFFRVATFVYLLGGGGEISLSGRSSRQADMNGTVSCLSCRFCTESQSPAWGGRMEPGFLATRRRPRCSGVLLQLAPVCSPPPSSCPSGFDTTHIWLQSPNAENQKLRPFSADLKTEETLSEVLLSQAKQGGDVCGFWGMTKADASACMRCDSFHNVCVALDLLHCSSRAVEAAELPRPLTAALRPTPSV